jgi:PAS domain S-box-containing protein
MTDKPRMKEGAKTARRAGPPKARPTIGVLISHQIHKNDYSMWQGVVDVAKKRDVNVVCFVGLFLGSPYGFEAQANVIYDLVSAEQLDGLVIMAGAITQFVPPEEKQAFIERFRPLPIVTLESEVEGTPNIYVDSLQNMRKVVLHLIQTHGYRRIAFIRGPENHQGANDRYRAYVEALAECGIPLDAGLVTPPLNWYDGRRGMAWLLDQRPGGFEAVVGSNDDMAIGAMQELQARGIRIPEEVAVVGYDDAAQSRWISPPLTTVPIETYKWGQQAAEILFALLDSQPAPEQVAIPTDLVVRESCGCVEAQALLDKEAQRALGYREVLAEQRAGILREIGSALIATFDHEELMDVLAHQLPRLDIGKAYLALYKDPTRPTGLARLLLAYDEEGRIEIEAGRDVFPAPQLVPAALWPPAEQFSLVTMPLYFREEQLGFAMFEAAPQDGPIYEALRAQISSALKSILLTQQIQRRALQLQTASEVSRAAASILNPDELLPQAVDLIRERFSLYYAGLFLVDETGEETGEPAKWAVLRAGTGEAGQRQLEIKHKLEIGGTSMIGWCVANKQARIALDVGKEAMRFDNPYVPETRSELALPLISRDRIIGALTIQSTRQAAFSPEDIVALQTMADQLANAVQNARLFAERLTVEQRLATERNMLRTLIDNLQDYVYIKDRQSRFVINNTAHLRVMGLKTQEEALGKIDFDFFPQELAAQYYADEQALMQADQTLKSREETVIDQTTGEKQWVSSTKVPLHDTQGNVIGFVGFTQDITARKAYEAERERLLAEAQQSEHLLRSVIDATPDWIFVKDQQHRYRLVNQGYATALHLAPDDFIGKDDVEIGFPEDLVKGNPEKGIRGFWADDRQVMDSGEPLVNPHVPVTIDGQMHTFHDVKIPLRDAAGHVWGVLGLGRDMTEREQLLADLERRSTELQAAAEISRAASSILDVDELTRRAVDLIRERLGLYYVGLFLVEETGGPGMWAMLQAGTGEAGRHMVESKHRLEVGGTSMIGWCVANKRARIALDVGEEAVRFDNPHLPETRSELALPLISRGEAIGALTIQSTREAAFAEEDVTTLQTMADQLANAVQNARLLEQTQAALAEVEATQRRYLQQAWADYAQGARSTGYETTPPGAAPLGEVVLPEIQQAIERQHAMTLTEGDDEGQRRSALVAPVALRGQVIGVLGVHDDDARQWTDGEIALVEAVAERMAQTAENLRLLDETQRRARREQTLREITARVRGSTDPDTIVRTALRELGTTLGRPAFARLGSAEQLRSPAVVTGRSPDAVTGRSPDAVTEHGTAAVTSQDSAPVAAQGLKPVEETRPSSPPGRRRRRDRKGK